MKSNAKSISRKKIISDLKKKINLPAVSLTEVMAAFDYNFLECSVNCMRRTCDS